MRSNHPSIRNPQPSRRARDRTGSYVFTRLDGFGRTGPDRIVAVRHVAHEPTHSVQGTARLCPAAVPSWGTEGWAEWAGFRVVDLAGLRPYNQQRSERIEVIRRAWERTFFPTLVQLDRAELARLVRARSSSLPSRLLSGARSRLLYYGR